MLAREVHRGDAVGPGNSARWATPATASPRKWPASSRPISA